MELNKGGSFSDCEMQTGAEGRQLFVYLFIHLLFFMQAPCHYELTPDLSHQGEKEDFEACAVISEGKQSITQMQSMTHREFS